MAVDPDPDTRAEVEALIAAGDEAGLADRFGDRLTFGTAGLRGEVAAGPNRMNRVVVRQAAGALGRRLPAASLVVIGFDARHKSDVFATDTAEVLAAQGHRAQILPGPLPTPVLAHAVLACGAAAGVMVTASHNPPADNGYKVYWGDGAQIVPPVDAEIEAEILAGGLPPLETGPPADGGGIERVGDQAIAGYVEAIAGALPGPAVEDLVVAYTPLHGVGEATLRRVFVATGLDDPRPTPSQARPDPDFPTVSFPNPEEPGAMDAVMAAADEAGAHLVVANDPDADRLAVAVQTPDGWRALRGDEIGTLLAHHLLSGLSALDRDRWAVATTLVSSSLLSKLAAAAGVTYVETLTGFKWIARAGDASGRRLLFGYEEALGYAVSDVVRDKDGISAAVVFVRLAAALHAEGRSPLDLLDDIYRDHGVHLTGQATLRFADIDIARDKIAGYRADPPAEIAGVAVDRRVDHLSDPPEGMIPADAIVVWLADGTRVAVRPSGTEPKLKTYIEVVVAVADGDLAAAHSVAQSRLDAVAAAMKQRFGGH